MIGKMRGICLAFFLLFGKLELFSHQKTHGVQDAQYRHAHIGEHRRPHVGDAQSAQKQDQKLYCQSEDYVAGGNPTENIGIQFYGIFEGEERNYDL